MGTHWMWLQSFDGRKCIVKMYRPAVLTRRNQWQRRPADRKITSAYVKRVNHTDNHKAVNINWKSVWWDSSSFASPRFDRLPALCEANRIEMIVSLEYQWRNERCFSIQTEFNPDLMRLWIEHNLNSIRIQSFHTDFWRAICETVHAFS